MTIAINKKTTNSHVDIKAILWMCSMCNWIFFRCQTDMSLGVYTPFLWVQTASGCSFQLMIPEASQGGIPLYDPRTIDWLEESQDAMGSGPNATNFGLFSTLA